MLPHTSADGVMLIDFDVPSLNTKLTYKLAPFAQHTSLVSKPVLVLMACNDFSYQDNLYYVRFIESGILFN